VAAAATDIVRTLQLTAVGAFVKCLDLQRIVRTTHTATRGRCFSLWDSHGGTISSNKYVCLRRRQKLIEGVILEGRPYGKGKARTSHSRFVHSFAGGGGKARAIP
jgi:hypothetical protein